MRKIQLCSLILFFLVTTKCLIAAEKSEQYAYLDALALESQTDKSSAYHNYTEIYARYFSSLREKPIKFLEIGIARGNSVMLWEKYFPNAQLHFIDIALDHVQYISERSHYYSVNQESSEELRQFIGKTGGDFDIIIDDGGHTMRQQIISFQELFPHIKSGGMYVIEDLHTSYKRSYLNGHRKTTIEYLKTLIDELNFVGAHTFRASHRNIDPSAAQQLNLFRESIESIHFYDSVAIITKR
jgi:Methyltransferase domain